MKNIIYFGKAFSKTPLALFRISKILNLSVFFLFFWCPVVGQNPVQENGALSVSGNRIVNSNNEVVSFAGTSLFWSNDSWGGEKYYNSDVVDWLRSDWEIGIIRAAMGVEAGGGYIQNPSSNKNKVTTVVNAAIANGVYVIIDWHSHHAEDYQSEAISFFQEMARTYGHTDNLIYEIYNEPVGGASWVNEVKPYAEAVIGAIRAIDPDNLIIVGSPTWSQDVDVASNDPITGYNNIAYTLHFYAGTHTQYLRDKATTALNNGIALMVTEWGTVDANGDGAVAQGSTQEWVDFMEANDLSHANWALNDKAEGASSLKPGASTTGGWADNDLTASGLLVRDIIRHWQGSGDGGNTCNVTPINPRLRVNSGSWLSSNQASVNVGDNLELAPNPTTGGSWSWVGPNNFSSSSRVVSINNIQPSQEGNYIATFTNDCGGTSNATFSVAVGEPGGDDEFCNNPTTVPIPYSQNGPGDFCFQTSGNISYINSWSLDLLEINGVNYTNQWSNSLPQKVNGKYYIHYVGSLGWSHFEMNGSSQQRKAASGSMVNRDHSLVYPNPSSGTFTIQIPGQKDLQDLILKVSDFRGNTVLTNLIRNTSEIVVDTQLPKGQYKLRVENEKRVLINENVIIK